MRWLVAVTSLEQMTLCCLVGIMQNHDLHNQYLSAAA